MNHDQGITNKL